MVVLRLIYFFLFRVHL